MRLTDISVRNLAAPDRGQKTYLDDSLTGFGVRVSQGGAKSFVLVYGPSRERTTIGRYPAISLQEARAKAREVIAERVLGKERAPSIGFSEAVRQFITTHCEANNKPRSAQETARLLNRHFLPPFRRVALRDVKTTAITKIIDGLQDRPALAGHAFTAARTFFHWAVRRRLLPHSPMEGLQMPRKPVSRDRVLTDAELVAVWALAPELGTFGTILRLLILTGQRCAQIAGLRAEHIDYADRVITWSPALMKGNRQHSIPYGEAVAEILEPLPKVGLLFPARGKETPYNGFSKGSRALRAALEDAQGADAEPFAHFTLHDLRRTMATGMARFGITPHVVERILDHRTGTISSVAAIYNRFQYIEEMRAALAVWEKHIAGLQTA